MLIKDITSEKQVELKTPSIWSSGATFHMQFSRYVFFSIKVYELFPGKTVEM